MNYSDSERVEAVLENLGYDKAEAPEDSDLILFNTCSVKQKAEDKVLGTMRKYASLRKQRPELLIGITGCMVRKTSSKNSAIKDQDKWVKKIENLDLAFRIEDSAKLGDVIIEANPKHKIDVSTDTGSLENYFNITPKRESQKQAWIPISKGCDKFCTYCIVPYSRGQEVSRDFEAVLKEAEDAVDNGAIEITLIGQTVNSYGLSVADFKSGKFKKWRDEKKSPFAALLREIDQLHTKGLKRLRFTSPHPRDFTDEVIETLASMKSFARHLHMPVQSGSNAVLRRMNRNYRKEEYLTILEKVKAAMPDIAITTDIIVGFCSETEDEYNQTVDMYKQLEWDQCFLSQYSPRRGTFAFKKLDDDIPNEVKKERWHKLNDMMRDISAKKNQAYKDQIIEVIVEKQVGKKCSARSESNKEVVFDSGRNLVGELVEVKITQPKEWLLEGELV